MTVKVTVCISRICLSMCFSVSFGLLTFESCYLETLLFGMHCMHSMVTFRIYVKGCQNSHINQD